MIPSITGEVKNAIIIGLAATTLLASGTAVFFKFESVSAKAETDKVVAAEATQDAAAAKAYAAKMGELATKTADFGTAVMEGRVARDTVTKENVRTIYAQPSTEDCLRSPAVSVLLDQLRREQGSEAGSGPRP